MTLKFRRILAAVIDFYIIGIILVVPLQFIDNYYDNNLVSIIIGVTFILLFIFLYCRKDCIFGIKSIGKRILKLNIYYQDKIVTDKNLLKNRVRYSFWTLPIYPFHILIDNKSLGDIKSDTQVK